MNLPFKSPPPPRPMDQWVPPAAEEDGEILNVLMDPDADLIAVLSADGLQDAYRDKNPTLLAKIDNIDAILEILHILATTTERKLIISIFRLFISANKSLLQKTTTSQECMDQLANILHSNEDDLDLFRVGIVTQILTVAVKKWPGDVFQVMTKSETVFPILLSRIDNDAIFNAVIVLAQTPPVWFHSFLWGFLTAYVSEEVRMPAPPKGWNISDPGIANCSHVRLTSCQKERVLQTISAFFKAFPDEMDFKNIMASVISFMAVMGRDQLIAIFELGLLLPGVPKLVAIALEIIDDVHASNELIEKALTYLAYAYDCSKIEPIVNFLFRVLNPEAVDNLNFFVTKAATKLISAMMERALFPRFFAKVAQHCIAYVWNRSQCLDRLSYRSVLLEIALIVGDTPSWNGWKQFTNDVLDPFAQKTGFDKDCKVPEENWDQALIEKLITQSAIIEMSPADRRPVCDSDSDSDDDFSDSRSAESGSYASNPSFASDTDIIGSPVLVLPKSTAVKRSQSYGTGDLANPTTENEKNTKTKEKPKPAKASTPKDDKKCAVA